MLLVFLAATGARGEDEPPPAAAPVERIRLAEVLSDPEGEATRLAREARTALAAEDAESAYEHLLDLAERHPDVLIPVSQFAPGMPGRADGALRWRARRVANHALAGLPEPQRARLERHWAASVGALWDRAHRGDLPALVELAADYAATPRGTAALLMLAERALEDGRDVRAARYLQEWMELNPEAPRAVRAGVLLRWVDALGRGEDAGALAALAVAYRALRDEPVRVGDRVTTLADRVPEWRARARARPEPQRKPFDPQGLLAPVMLWSRSLADPNLLSEGRRLVGLLGVRAGAWIGDGAAILHEGRTVRRLDLLTGLERWRFPDVEHATVHDPRDRYRSYDLPFRGVTPAPGRVLVALGEPAATGRYKFRGQEYDNARLGHECRMRLVCLDRETGRPIWITGGPGEVHPVLGHAATGCASPPLVIGDRIYCVFARRLGATAFFLACLDLDTGRPRWVTPLATGRSGRSDDRAGEDDRFTGTYVRAIPWGARPRLHDGEICVLPHAGFAAGLDAETGGVRWLRALPRYSLSVVEPASSGHNVHNEPWAWGDAWLIAPMDSPRLLCLARGNGDLRWQRGGQTPADPPAWRDLLGIVPASDGRAHIRLSGWRPFILDPADGSLAAPEHLHEWIVDAGDPGGRTLDAGDHLMRAAAGAIQVQAWDASAEGGPGGPAELLLDEPGCPRAGDLYRSGDVMLLVGLDRVAALAPPESLYGLRAALDSGGPVAAVEAEGDASGHAARLGLFAALDHDPTRLLDAVRVAERVAPGPVRARLWALLAARAEDVARGLAADDAGLRTWRVLASGIEAMPVGHRGSLLADLARVLFARGADEQAARLLLRWMASADDALVPADEGERPPGRRRLRSDLLAAELLRSHAGRTAVRMVLEEREVQAEERLRAASALGEAPLRAALRRAAGTRAAAAARGGLMRRLVERGRFADAAAIAADLRLDPPWLDLAEPVAARLRRAARLQLDEAGWLGRAHEDLRARTLAADIERWGPAGTKDAAGRTQTVLREHLRLRFGWNPERESRPRTLNLWRDQPGPKDRDEIRSIEPLALRGPGAARLEDLLLLVRGLTPEIWSLRSRTRLAALPGTDQGWFGGNLTAVDPWVPGGGILVRSTVAGEPADEVGVQAGDWIRSWDGHPVRNLPTFMNLVAASRPGVEIPIGVHRAGRRVMDRFTPGRRPPRQGRLLDYEALWTDAEGRVLVPGRTGLAWLDARARTRETAWTWSEPGVVRSATVVDGRAFVLVQRGLHPDLVVAVDPQTGREAWRRDVYGRVSWVAPVGSALWIQSVSPAGALMVDRHDGRPRAHWRCFDFERDEFRKSWAPTSPAAIAAGRGYLVTGGEGPSVFSIVNTTTGRVEHTEAADENRDTNLPVNPHVSAGAYVARVHYVPRLRRGRVRLTFPDPLGGAPRHVIDVKPTVIMDNASHYGELDNDARVYVRGSTTYIVRVPWQGRRNVNVSVLGVDYAALAARSATGTDAGGGAIRMRTNRIWIGGTQLPTRYVMQIQPRFEGIFVSAGRLGGEHRVEDWWVAALGSDEGDDNRDVRLRLGERRDGRRSLPVRVGARLLVPSDDGVEIFPVRGYRK